MFLGITPLSPIRMFRFKQPYFHWIYAICNPHSFLHLQAFLNSYAKVSATFIFIRAFPYICVYRNPWFSFAVPKILSIVSLRCEYKSFIPVLAYIFACFHVVFPNMSCNKFYMIFASCALRQILTSLTDFSAAFCTPDATSRLLVL